MSDYNRTNKNNKNRSSEPSWLLIVIAFAVFWPVGLAMLIYKLSQSSTVQEAKRDWRAPWRIWVSTTPDRSPTSRPSRLRPPGLADRQTARSVRPAAPTRTAAPPPA